MQNKFIQHLSEKHFFSKEDQLLVGVSGGVDSMVLSNLLFTSGYSIALAHCNYQLRDEASIEDEKLVREFAEQHGIPIHVKTVNTTKIVKNSNSSTQMVAREQRYAFFEELMDDFGYKCTVLAHNADDRIESLLINVLRGTGIRGLQGMPEIRDRFARPMLFARKKDIRSYALEHHVQFLEDSSNTDVKYQRNWVRLRLIPLLGAIDTAFEEKLLALTERVAASIPKYMKTIEEEILKISNGSQYNISIERLAHSKFPFTVLREMLNSKGFSSDQIFEVLSLIQAQSGSIVQNENFRILRDRELLNIEKKKESLKEPTLTFHMFDRESLSSLHTPPNNVLLDSDLIKQEQLKLRHWQQGDRFRPFGMKGWKKLSDFFIDQKLSVSEKDKTWILTQGRDIVWIVGMRMDDRFKVTSKTKKVLKVSALN